MSLHNSFQRIYGLVGHPLGHSFSASYFNKKFEREGISARYFNFDLPDASEVRQLFTEHPNLCGLNVTIPHKKNVIPCLDRLNPDAAEIGAVNVIKPERTGGKLYLTGYNTDYLGFRDALPANGATHRAALILGTGGASKAVEYALKSLGIKTTFVSRKPGKGILTYETLDAAVMAKHTLIVNTTPLGMYPNTDACPDIPYHLLTTSHFLYDLVYNPAETLFMKRGEAYGASTLNGLKMLEGQAIAAWQIWTVPPQLP